MRNQTSEFDRVRFNVRQFGKVLRMIGDAIKPGVKHVEQRADPRQQEDRGKGDLDDMGDIIHATAAAGK